MMRAKVYSFYNPPPVVMEVHADEGKVEVEGYMSTEALINQFILAGERLAKYRGTYATLDDVDDEDVGDRPMLPLDAMQVLKNQENILNAKKAAAKAAAELEAEEKARKPVEVKDGNGNT